MGQVEFKDFLWEALLDPAAISPWRNSRSPRQATYISREEVDIFAADSFARAVAAQKGCSSVAKSCRS